MPIYSTDCYFPSFLQQLFQGESVANADVNPYVKPLHTLSKLYDVPVGFVTPPPIWRLNIAYFAVAEGWLLLDIG